MSEEEVEVEVTETEVYGDKDEHDAYDEGDEEAEED